MQSSYTYTPVGSDASGIGLAALLIWYLVMILFFGLPSIITTWKLYKKASQPGWASIVPIYNVVVELEIAKMPVWYLVLLFVPFVNIVVAIMVLINFIKQYEQKIGFWLAYIFLPIVAVFLVDNVNYTGGAAVAAGPVAPVAPTQPFEPSVQSSVPQQPVAPVEPEQVVPLTENTAPDVLADVPSEEPDALESAPTMDSAPAEEPQTDVTEEVSVTPAEEPQTDVTEPTPVVAAAPAGEDDDQTPRASQPPVA